MLLAVVLWWSLALHFRLPGPSWPATAIAIAYALAAIVVLVRLRPYWRAVAVVLASFGLLLVWWSMLRPSNDLDWAPEYARIPYGELAGDRLVMHNIRVFDYRTVTDFTPHWEDRTYDLSRLRELDLFMSYWGSPWMAHTIVSWVLRGRPAARHLHRDAPDPHPAVLGHPWILSRVRDLLRGGGRARPDRAAHELPGGAGVSLSAADAAGARARILLDYLASMNVLVKEPAWYNALTDNCTTSIQRHLKRIAAPAPLDWRLFANGYADQMLYERGVVDTRVPFEELKAKSFVVPKAQAAGNGPDFSARIRDGVPRP